MDQFCGAHSGKPALGRAVSRLQNRGQQHGVGDVEFLDVAVRLGLSGSPLVAGKTETKDSAKAYCQWKTLREYLLLGSS